MLTLGMEMRTADRGKIFLDLALLTEQSLVIALIFVLAVGGDCFYFCFICMGVLLACLSVHHMHSWCPERPEGPLELELQCEPFMWY